MLLTILIPSIRTHAVYAIHNTYILLKHFEYTDCMFAICNLQCRKIFTLANKTIQFITLIPHKKAKIFHIKNSNIQCLSDIFTSLTF